ncbi:MAG: amino acid ABC transporter permease [Acidimicrobiales bacterium]
MATPNFLGDELGPGGRRRVLEVTAASLVVIVAVVVVATMRFADKGQLRAALWRPLTQWSVVRFLLGGFVNTIKAAAVAMVLAMIIGAVMALARLDGHRAVQWPAGGYVEFFRALPLLLLIFFSFVALPPMGVHPSAFQALVVGLAIYNGAVLGEIFRAGILSLDRGQGEAASAVGLTHRQSMTAVILPQAARRMAPAIVSQLITLLKDTALGVVIGYDDALRRADNIGSFYNNRLQAYLFVAVCYIAVNLVLSRISHRLEVRQQRRLGAAPIEVVGVEDLAVMGAQASSKI